MVRGLRPWLKPLNLLGPGLAIAACVGSIGDGGSTSGSASVSAPGLDGSLAPGTSTTQAGCTTLSPGPSPLRRLTQPEYNNTVRDLLGDSSSPASTFPPDQRQGDFSNTAVALTVSPLLAQSYQTAAEALATTAIGHLSTIVACDTTAMGEDACAAQFVTTFGKRAFRRPLTQGEFEQLTLAAIRGDLGG